MNDEQLYERIEAYLAGTLPPEARAAVEAEIATNEDAALELRRQQLELEAMQLMLADKLRADVHQWMAEEDNDNGGDTPAPAAAKPPARRPWRRLLPIAILAMLAGALGLLVWQQAWWNGSKDEIPEIQEAQSTPPMANDDTAPPPDVDQPTKPPPPVANPPTNTPRTTEAPLALAGRFYEGPPKYHTRGQTPDNPDDPLAAPRRAFDQGQFAAALTLLHDIGPDSDFATGAEELRAHTLYQLSRYAEAAEAFARVAAAGIPPYAHRAEWNHIVSLLPLLPASKPQIITLLQDLRQDPQHPYAANAAELVGALFIASDPEK